MNSEDSSFSQAYERWKDEYEKSKKEDRLYTNLSFAPIEPLYTRQDVQKTDEVGEVGFPGQYPYTRGIYPTMYRGRLWTMRQFAGFGTARQTNERFKYLIGHGQTGLSTAFDMPTLMGYDSDHAQAQGEVGREGVAICTLEDMQTLFDGIPLDRVSTSMTINCTAPIALAFYLATADAQGVPWDRLNGTIQNDILKEYQAQKEWIFPPEPSLRLIVDTFEFCANHVPKWHPISISGYHIREAGSTAVQELAFTLANGFAYVEAALQRGLAVDQFAPRLSFFFNAHMDFFEEIAKFRAARRLWAKRMKNRYGAEDPRSCQLRFHTQTAGCSLTAQQPFNNIVRTTLEALSAVLGGTQSLHTNSMDEALSLPTEEAVKIALRTQQIMAYESGVAHTADSLAGSYYVETLTNRMEEEAEKYFRQIDDLGGVLAGIEQGFFQREIARASYQYQQEVERNRRVVVGVNRFQDSEEKKIDILKINPALEEEQIRRVRQFKAARDASRLQQKLKALQDVARHPTQNTMSAILEAVRAQATLGEISQALKEVFGSYREPAHYW